MIGEFLCQSENMDLTQPLPVLSSEQVLHNLKSRTHPAVSGYFAYFSTWLGGIVTDTTLMLLPMDDHIVHRGDGVFEAIKAVDRRIFLFHEHLARLQISASRIGLKLPFSMEEMEKIIIQTLKVANQKDVLLRMFVSRGPGGYTTNPYDSIGSQLYLTVTALPAPKAESFQVGVHIGRSQIPVKDSWLAQVKSCNYLANVLMKKESVDRNLSFTVSFDRDNALAESSTENIIIVDSDGILTMPPFTNILKGTTMVRVFELAKKAGVTTAQRPITEAELLLSREVMMIGTTLDVLPVTCYEKQKIANGEVGPISKQLRQLLLEDFKKGKEF